MGRPKRALGKALHWRPKAPEKVSIASSQIEALCTSFIWNRSLVWVLRTFGKLDGITRWLNCPTVLTLCFFCRGFPTYWRWQQSGPRGKTLRRKGRKSRKSRVLLVPRTWSTGHSVYLYVVVNHSFFSSKIVLSLHPFSDTTRHQPHQWPTTMATNARKNSHW